MYDCLCQFMIVILIIAHLYAKIQSYIRIINQLLRGEYTMLTHERHQKIIHYIEEKIYVTNQELLQLLFVSEATLRRDLTKLEVLGFIERTHGGAHIKDTSQQETSISLRQQKNVREKKRIAEKAINYIKHNHILMIDSSSTVGALMPLLIQKQDLTVITNGVDHIRSFLEHRVKHQLILTPGMFNLRTNSLLGHDTISYISHFFSDICIFSCGGISHVGITESNHEQSLVKQAMLKQAKFKILLVDHTKFDIIHMSHVCNIEDIDLIITDQIPSDNYLEMIKKTHCELMIV